MHAPECIPKMLAPSNVSTGSATLMPTFSYALTRTLFMNAVGSASASRGRVNECGGIGKRIPRTR